MNTDHWITAVLALRKAKRVVVFTGAGMSAESGIPTFRDADGFWQRFPPEKFGTRSGLLETALTQPRSLAEFVLNVVEPIAKARPNAGHEAVAAMGARVKTTVITQNIDGLHQAAGSSDVWEIHGSLFEVVDASTGHIVEHVDRSQLDEIADTLRKYVAYESSLFAFLRELKQRSPLDWLGRHRPNLVLFGDALAEPAWTNACRDTDECDLFLSVGTSGVVYPAALLPECAAARGTTVVTVDPEPNGECPLQGTAATVLPELLRDAFHDSGIADSSSS